MSWSKTSRFIPTYVGNITLHLLPIKFKLVHPHTSGEYVCKGVLDTDIVRFIPTQVGNTNQSICGETGTTVHPHTSGEYPQPFISTSIRSGSSPHKWGIQRKGFIPCSILRFIPTQVGNTACSLPVQGHLPVHPHTSGEYQYPSGNPLSCCGSSPHKWGIRDICSSCVNLAGSSPHKWGIRRRSACTGRFSRFIPTQVGNTR